jgi:hypothetical protein
MIFENVALEVMSRQGIADDADIPIAGYPAW